MKSTPITFMEQTTAIQTLQQRQTTNKCPSSSREIQVPPRSSHEGEGRGRTKNRIKRSSFTHEVKKLQKDYPAVLTIPTIPLSKQDFTNPCENTTLEIQIKTTIPQLDQGKELDASIRCSIALVNIAEIYPPAKFSNGSQHTAESLATSKQIS